VLDFLRGAAADPRVLAIKQTCTAPAMKSPIVDALVTAAQSGKDVDGHRRAARALRRGSQHRAVRIACRRRARTLCMEWWDSRRTPRCRWSYGASPMDLAPLLPSRHRQLSPAHRRGYTDYSLFTCDPEIGQDVHELFLQLTSLTQTPRLTKLLQSPFGLHERSSPRSIVKPRMPHRAGRPASSPR